MFTLMDTVLDDGGCGLYEPVNDNGVLLRSVDAIKAELKELRQEADLIMAGWKQ